LCSPLPAASWLTRPAQHSRSLSWGTPAQRDRLVSRRAARAAASRHLRPAG
jgi:hypothetical protein